MNLKEDEFIMNNISKVIVNEGLCQRSLLTTGLILISIGTLPGFTAEKEFVISAPSRAVAHKTSEVGSFSDMETKLFEVRDRIAKLAPLLAQDQKLHVQVIKSFASLLEGYVIFKQSCPNAMEGTFKDVLSPRGSDETESHSQKDGLKIVDKFRERLGPLCSSLSRLEELMVPQVPVSTSSTHDNISAIKDSSLSLETRQLAVENLHQEIMKATALLRSNSTPSEVINIVRNNSGMGSPRKDTPTGKGETRGADSPRTGTSPAASGSPVSGRVAPRLIEAAAPKSGDSGQNIASVAGAAAAEAMRRRSSSAGSQSLTRLTKPTSIPKESDSKDGQ